MKETTSGEGEIWKTEVLYLTEEEIKKLGRWNNQITCSETDDGVKYGLICKYYWNEVSRNYTFHYSFACLSF